MTLCNATLGVCIFRSLLCIFIHRLFLAWSGSIAV